jgi:Response regulator containing CheY-like receiver, AAA-type ATPase, and DNA-binding domains
MVHVLVVDDERDFADLLAERLRTRGMEVHTAYSGQEALAVVRALAPEVVVLDITMPGMSGLETLDAVKAEKPSPEVILLTADSTLNTAVAGMKGGAWDYLTKPTDIDMLVAAIGEAEGRRMESCPGSAWPKQPSWLPWESWPQGSPMRSTTPCR